MPMPRKSIKVVVKEHVLRKEVHACGHHLVAHYTYTTGQKGQRTVYCRHCDPKPNIE